MCRRVRSRIALGSVEHALGEVEFAPCLTPPEATTGREATLRRRMLLAGTLGALGVHGEPLPVTGRRPVDEGELDLRVGESGLPSRSRRRVRIDSLLRCGEIPASVGVQLSEPVRDPTTTPIA